MPKSLVGSDSGRTDLLARTMSVNRVLLEQFLPLAGRDDAARLHRRQSELFGTRQ
jgi:hypothetical protein